jgi:hypothetical protein
MHFGAFDIEPYYRSIPDALERFLAGARNEGGEAMALEVGASISL